LTDPFDLTGKTAIVTGGSRGLGAEMCHAFAARGADVVVASRKVDACHELAAELTERYGSAAYGVACHVGKWEDCDALVAEVLQRSGRIDVLVNNAGMSPLYPSLTDVTEDLFDKVFAVNLKGPFRLCALVGKEMMLANGGSIINVSSTAAVEPSPIEVPYALAKSGLNTLTTALAHMFGPRVRVNAIMPGPFLTDISDAWDLDEFKRVARTEIPLQRGGQPREIAGAALYLASGASSYTSGAVIKIDGGRAWSAS